MDTLAFVNTLAFVMENCFKYMECSRMMDANAFVTVTVIYFAFLKNWGSSVCSCQANDFTKSTE